MKIVKNVILIIIILLAAFIIYFNFHDIKIFFNSVLFENEIIIPETNEFKRTYNYDKFKISDNFIPKNKDDLYNIYFNVLNNGWENFTFYCPFEYKSCLDDIENVSADNTGLSNINGYINPYNSFKIVDTTITSFGEIIIRIEKNYTKDQIRLLQEKVKEIVNNLNLINLSDREKITQIHNYIISHTTYDSERAETKTSKYASDKAYGVLFEGYGVCSGYSDALSLFLDYFNIPNIKLSNEEHVWNLVYIENNWLHVDITWDDNDKAHLPKTSYLLITTEKLAEIDEEQHNFDKNFFIEAN